MRRTVCVGGWAAPWAASAINESHFSCRLATEGAEKRAKGKRSREIKVGGRDEEGIRKDQMFCVSTIEYHISCLESNFVFNRGAPAQDTLPSARREIAPQFCTNARRGVRELKNCFWFYVWRTASLLQVEHFVLFLKFTFRTARWRM